MRPRGNGANNNTIATKSLNDYQQWTEDRNARFDKADLQRYWQHTNIPTTYEPEKEINLEELDAACEEQVRCFGRTEWSARIKSSHTTYKVSKKEKALDFTLRTAFVSRDKRNSETLTLDEHQDSDWIPTSGDPIDYLIEQEDAELRVNRIATFLEGLTDRQREALELIGEGLTQRAVADRLGISQKNVSKLLGKARKSASVLTF